MADLVARIRAALARYGTGAFSPVYTATLVRTLRAVVDQCEANGQHSHETVSVDWLLETVAAHLGIDTTPAWKVASVTEADRGALSATARFVLAEQCGASSTIQRKLGLRFSEVARFLDLFQSWGLVGPAYGSMARKVLVPAEQADAVVGAIRMAAAAGDA